MHVLLADDDLVVRHLVGAMLQSSNIRASIAESGAQCMSLLESLKNAGDLPQAILLDLQLQDIHGAELALKIRELLKPVELPIIMLSANSEEEVRALFPDLKASAYLPKPFSQETLLASILQAVN